MYMLTLQGKELHRAPTPHGCLSHAALTYPSLTVKDAIKLGMSIDPLLVEPAQEVSL